MDAIETTIEGLTMPLETPESAELLAARVQELATRGTALYPIGGRLGLDYGKPPSRGGVAISLTHLTRIIDYPIEDLTITVEAGMTVGALNALLGNNNQRLPIDVPNAEKATIGGAIAVNAVGPRRLAYGTWRDSIIGMTVVNDRGELCKSGGRVVKNVAGYDLGKLYTGSLGTLGFITQVTLKLQPRPERQQWVAVDDIAPTDLTTILNQIHGSATQPRAVELRSMGGCFSLFVLFEDNAESVNWQVEQIRREIAHPIITIESESTEPNLRNREPMESCALQLIATMLPSRVGPFLNDMSSQSWAIAAHAMNGIVWIGSDVNHLPDARSLVQMIATRVNSGGGNVVVRRCPLEWKAELPIWGRPPASLGLMKKVKQEFDPKNILNPGRTLI